MNLVYKSSMIAVAQIATISVINWEANGQAFAKELPRELGCTSYEFLKKRRILDVMDPCQAVFRSDHGQGSASVESFCKLAIVRQSVVPTFFDQVFG